MTITTPITAAELTDLLGELDAEVAARILDLRPSFDDVCEAIAMLEEESSAGVPHEPSTTKALDVLRILEEVLYDIDEPAAAYDYAVPV